MSIIAFYGESVKFFLKVGELPVGGENRFRSKIDYVDWGFLGEFFRGQSVLFLLRQLGAPFLILIFYISFFRGGFKSVEIGRAHV